MTGSIIYEMIKLNGSDARRINHSLKVFGLAKCIAEHESVDSRTLTVIEAAAVLHDIAIRFCEDKYGSCAGHLQEREGPGIARPLLEKYTDDNAFIERVLYIIAHHHTYGDIDGMDYQIIIEADFIVNAEEGDITRTAFSKAYEKHFRTNAGKDLANIIINAGTKAVT